MLRSFQSDYWEKEMTLFSLGGGVNTPDRWQIDKLPPQYAYISWYKNHFYLMPGNGRNRIQMSHRPHQKRYHFSQISFPLIHSDRPDLRLIIGKTYYDVTFTDTYIRFEPYRNTDAWFDDKPSEQIIGNARIYYNTASFIGMGSIHIADFFKKILVRLISICLIALILAIVIYRISLKSERFQLMVMIVPSVILTGISITSVNEADVCSSNAPDGAVS